MLEFALEARRGGFHLDIACRLSAEWTVVFGHSGSGKSTLLRLLAGLDRCMARSCRVAFRGSELAALATGVWVPPGRRRTALVAQQPALFPHLSVEANVGYALTGIDREQCKQRVNEMLELVDGKELASRRPTGLSGGEAQRVALARALAPQPELLLLDEPFSALDGPAADALIDRLRAWVRRHDIQTVMATHEAGDAFATGAEVALLEEGKLMALGAAVEVLAQERDRITARLSTGTPRLEKLP